MNITIDGEKIDYRIEQEHTLHDVVQSLENWLSRHQALVVGIAVDGKPVDPVDRASLAARPLDGVGDLDVVTSSVSEVAGEGASAVGAYLDRFQAALDAGSDEIAGDAALDGLAWTVASLRLLANVHGIDLDAFPERGASLAGKLAGLEDFLRSLLGVAGTAERLRRFADGGSALVTGVFADARDLLLLADRGRSPEALAERLRLAGEAFAARREAIAAIAGDLATGREREAMDAIRETALLLEDLTAQLERVRSFFGLDYALIAHEGSSVADWLGKLVETGREVIEAFGNQDAVLLGDLFEYELGPETERAPVYVRAVLERIAAGDAAA